MNDAYNPNWFAGNYVMCRTLVWQFSEGFLTRGDELVEKQFIVFLFLI